MLLTLAIALGSFGLLVGIASLTYPGRAGGRLNENSRGVAFFAAEPAKMINGYV